jgi:pSer/pThr/pTyr-binding forkhead associated (FHA) protein
MAPDDALIMEMPVRMGQEFDILLTPVSRPELGEIRIGDDLFAVGRTEAPFVSYPEELTAALSRRHARIFAEHGAVYVADLGSKNGTRINGADVAGHPLRLSDGDELSFGSSLSFHVRLSPRLPAAEPPRVAVTLQPERNDLGLQPIELNGFPYLISKADDTFARYRDSHPQQVNYLSRRHAHIYLKCGVPFLEDLGSTNGTFINGHRLADHGVPLNDGDLIAFGGSHFVYKVAVQREGDADATATRTVFAGQEAAAEVEPVAEHAAAPIPEDGADKTTFVGAADSFLDIFCVDYAARQEDEVNAEAEAQAAAATDASARKGNRPRSRPALLAAEIIGRFGLNDPVRLKRAGRWGAALVALVAVGLVALYLRGMPERDVKSLLAKGQYAQAAKAADAYLAGHPDDAPFQAMGTEALLRAYVPQWAGKLKTQDFHGAATVLAELISGSQHNADARPLVSELEWIGNLERYFAQRGGADAPIRLYTDEAVIRGLLTYWNQDTAAHQRALGRIAGYEPAFRDVYASALSDVRKLQTDESVYLAAIERLNATIATELARDQPEALQPVLADYKEKYPRLSGLDKLQDDLSRYIALMQPLRSRNPGPLVARMADAKFATPPFQAQYARLAQRLPDAEVARQYAAAAQAWQRGDSATAIAGLRRISAGAWADDVARDAAHKQQVAAQYAALQGARGASGYEDKLLGFYAMLDPDEDRYYAKAMEADVTAIRDSALRRAREQMSRAIAGWKQYRANGQIGSEQRLEPGISPKFRDQARRLAQAQEDARQGIRIVSQLKAGESADLAQWNKAEEEIRAEVDQQRRALQELRMVLDPAVLKAKLELLGGEGQGAEAQAAAAPDKPKEGRP